MKRIPFITAVRAAHKGERIVYHVGSLMYDRLVGPEFQAIHATAVAAMELSTEGKCLLMQRKVGPLTYEYMAQKL